MLRGRRRECEAVDAMLEAARGGHSAVMVLCGEAGIGKTALLEYAVESAADLRVARAAGVESEMELPFATLHQLCAAILDRLERLPEPQRDALRSVFGLSAGPAPDRFMVALAVLSLLSEVAEERPLLCVVDDAQWLDRASAQALGFAARRLLAEPVAVLAATREPDAELQGLPELTIGGLGDDDARELLSSAIPFPLDERVRDRIVAETQGNPLALLELHRGVSPAQLAGGFVLPGVGSVPDRLKRSFLRRIEGLSEPARMLTLVAAAEPVGDPSLLWAAADRLGLPYDALASVEATGLLETGGRVRFRHPLVRSAIYRGATITERQRAHAALAEATDTESDPDRRAWHRAQAAPAPDEDVAAELERSAGRAEARGGLAAAAAFLARATDLTIDPARRAQRALTAAQASYLAGAAKPALGLLATAEAGPLDQAGQARADMLRAQISYSSNRGRDAPALLLRAARRLEPVDPDLARSTYLDALSARIVLGRGDGDVEAEDVARAALAAREPSDQPCAADLLLAGVARRITGDLAGAAPALRRAVIAYRSLDTSADDALRQLWLACRVALVMWDDESFDLLTARHVELARRAGAMAVMHFALTARAASQVFTGHLMAAAQLIEELRAVTEATGSRLPPYGPVFLAAWRGREPHATALIEATTSELRDRGEGPGVAITDWASAVLYNGLGRYSDALAAATRASEHPGALGIANWGLVERIEAAVRAERSTRDADALRRLAAMTRASGSDWALGIEARSRALLSDDDVAEGLYCEAIERLARTRVRSELARAHLLYGEWLRRERRRADARTQLRTAHELLDAIGMEAFARRAERELRATGGRARLPDVQTLDELTAQELQIARMARDGLSNPEIGARLFISPRTVKYHLHKVFAKLEIASRSQLAVALLGSRITPVPARTRAVRSQARDGSGYRA